MSDYFYHITYFNRLGGIQSHGLITSARGAIGGAGLEGHKRGRVFITSPGGVSFWFGRADDWGYHNSDDQLGDGLFPVILRFPEPDNFDDVFIDDWIGTREARAQAFMGDAQIPADMLEVYFDGEWRPIDDHQIDVERGFDEDGYFLPTYKNPFYWQYPR